MNRSRILPTMMVAVLGVAVAAQVWAYPEEARKTKASCVSCHANVAGGAGLNDAGTAYKADKKAPAASEAKSASYVGEAKCKMCHMKQHKAWLETPHAKAWDALTKAEPAKVAEMATALKVEVKGSADKADDCVRCHVTGFQLAGGHPQSDAKVAPTVMSVGCEACHGPGSLHVTAPMAEKKKFIAKATEKMCLQCHTPAMSPKFAFAEYSKKVHPVPAASTK